MGKLKFFDPDCPSDDPIDGLLDRLTGDDSKTQPGCRIHRNAETGAVAVFPSVPFYPQGSHEQRELEKSWEARAILMHSEQVPITVADKPLENVLAKVALERGD